MVNLIIIGILFLVLVISMYRLQLGYTLTVACMFLIPKSAMFSNILPSLTKINFLLLSFSAILFLKEKNAISKLPKQLLRPFIFFIIINTILFVCSYVVPKSQQFSRYFSEIIFIMFALEAYLVFKSKQDIILFSKILIVCVLLVTLYGMYTYISGNSLYVDFIDLYFRKFDNEFRVEGLNMSRGFLGARIQSTFDHPLSLGQIFVLVFGFISLCFKKLQLHKGYQFAILTLVGIIVFLTGSRAAFFSLVPFLIVSFISARSKYKLIALGVVFGSVILIEFNILNIPNDVNHSLKASIFFWDNSLQNSANYSGSSVDMRADQINAALNKLEKVNPIFGYGIGFREFNQKKLNGIDPELLGYESVFLLKLVEQGFLGLVAFFVLIYQIFRLVPKKLPLIKWGERLTFLAYFSSFVIGISMTGVRPYSFFLFVIFFLLYIKCLETQMETQYAEN
jgi:hypothetical protein